LSAKGRLSANTGVHGPARRAAPARTPECAARIVTSGIAKGRPEGEHRSAQHEAGPATRALLLFRALLLGIAIAATGGIALAADVPFLTGRIVDHAEILKPATRERIGAGLQAHETATGNEIAVLTVTTLDGESIEGSRRACSSPGNWAGRARTTGCC
jgi:hypothetical protein